MIRKISYYLANYIYHKEHTTHAERFGYYYIIQLFIFQIYETILLLLLALLFGCLKEVIIIIISFIFLRNKYNTYHAHTQNGCIIFSSILIIGCSLISKYLSLLVNIRYVFIIISCLMSICLILLLKTRRFTLMLNKIEKWGKSYSKAL
mgnify:CR=1 FL=1